MSETNKTNRELPLPKDKALEKVLSLEETNSSPEFKSFEITQDFTRKSFMKYLEMKGLKVKQR